MNGEIKKSQILICAGTGGVGKTTISAALGLSLAKNGLSVLVLTIDPAKRLAEALSIDTSNSDKPVEVKSFEGNGKFYAMMLEPSFIFDRFIEKAAGSETRINKIKENSLYKQLSTTLSGSQEFTALECLVDHYESGTFDIIILDTPPAQHAIDFLEAPQKFYALFQSNITQWFVSPKNQKGGFFRKILQKGTVVALNSMEKITGSDFIKELTDFFDGLMQIQNEVMKRSAEAHKLLTGDNCQFILVTSFDRGKFLSTLEFIKNLNQGGYKIGPIIINRCLPKWKVVEKSSLPNQDLLGEITEFESNLSKYFEVIHRNINEFKQNLGILTNIYEIPDLMSASDGLLELDELNDWLTPICEQLK